MVLLVSCFKDEPLNAECDVVRVSVRVSSPETMFFNLSDTAVQVPYHESMVVFSVRPDADLTALAPVIEVTPGATIVPASGSVQDFSHGAVTYVVTSQDRAWSRTYQIAFDPVKSQESDELLFDFEDYELEPLEQRYYLWSDDALSPGSPAKIWASGNGGFRLSMSSAKPEDYPTVPVTDGYEGSAVKLTTRSTGPFGEMVSKRLAAGSIFLGEFDVATALISTLQSTHFGVPISSQPVTLSGYYKFRPGETFQDPQGKPVAGRTDEAAIYAVFFRNHDDAGARVTLYGDNVKSHPNIVAMADMGFVQPTDEWTYFELPFNYTETLDPDLLANQGYSLTVVFSSSAEGDLFSGAVGSTLYIDQVKINCNRE